jgi:DNA invertase Pin-like site-specific DNA recombinase
MNRDEWQQRARELAPRGEALPQSKLTDDDVLAIRAAQKERDAQRQRIATELSNAALARRFGVHVRTVEKVLQRDTWAHLLRADVSLPRSKGGV